MRAKYKVGLVIVAAVALLASVLMWLRGANLPVLKPAGTVGQKEEQLMVIALLMSLIVVVPVFTLLGVIAWRYREGNKKQRKYRPNEDGNRLIEVIWWAIPGALILVLSIITWQSAHSLDPFKPLQSNTKPITIQVVALDWKWLFIYPEQHIATVNEVELPVNTPVTFETTSDTVMNSFWIPSLGGQIYAMPGMSTELHLMAKQTGAFTGSSANISGKGFAGMTFTVRAASAADFTKWVTTVKQSSNGLTQATYDTLAKPTTNNPVAYYGSADTSLYDTIVMKYMMPGMNMQTTEMQ